MSDIKEPKITLFLTWVDFTPDHRQWKPSNPKITVDLQVAIEVPMTPEFIYNAAHIAAQQIVANQKVDEPILTPMGMRYCIDQFESAMSDAQPVEEEAKKEETSDWDDSEEEPKKSEKAEDWNDETDVKPTVDGAPWDDDWEN